MSMRAFRQTSAVAPSHANRPGRESASMVLARTRSWISSIAVTLLCALMVLPTRATDIPAVSKVYSQEGRDLALVNGLNAYIPEMMKLINTPGFNIAVARGGKLIWEGAYGYADVASKSVVTPDTVFRSGSMGKTYTGVAIMQLVDQGVISLDDPINKHLPFTVTNPYGGDEITVFHLMTHTSGMTGDAAASVFSKPRPLAEALEEIYSRETQPMLGRLPTWAMEPGKQRLYSNIGIATLGLIVERANPGELSFTDYVEKHIMLPLGMESTQYPPAQSEEYVRPDIWKRMSTGYNTMGDVWIPTPLVYFEEFPAGGFVSVPREHLRLLMAMHNGGELDGARILRADTAAQMLTQQVDGYITHGVPRPREQQGLIWWLRDWDKPHKAFHHGGGHMYGWRTMAMYWPEYDTGVVFAFNEWSALANKGYYPLVENFIETWLRNELPPRPALPADIDNLAWKASYLRGLLFVEGYRFGIGVPEILDPLIAVDLARQASVDTWVQGSPAWDQQAFVRGVRDMNAVTPEQQAVQEFVRKQMRISLDEAKALYPLISDAPATFANLGGLLQEQQE